MGLIQNILLSLVHLLFVVFDLHLLMILVKVVYNRWQLVWLEKVSDAIEPVMDLLINFFQKMTISITGKTYSKSKSTVLVFIILSVLRFVIANLVIH